MQSGELIVTGKNSIHVPVNKFPSEVKCRFKDEFAAIPCNPDDADRLEYEIIVSTTTPTTFTLFINWKVTGVREIKWEVAY
jgi:hypothetical protein